MDTNQALIWLSTYGPAALVVVLVLARIGIPLAATVVLAIAGGLVAQGVLHPAATVACGFGGLVAGDVLAYVLGERTVARMLTRFDRMGMVVRARVALERFGGLSVLLSRFLLLPLTVAMSYLAAAAGLGWRQFLPPMLFGNLLFLLIFLGLGYFFGGNWQAVWLVLQGLTVWQWILALAAVASLALSGWLWQRRTRRIGPTNGNDEG